ncbi:MAG: WYL domain-containing protein, partial [Woeseiaceae bacterium]
PMFGHVFAAIDEKRKVRISYVDAGEQASERVIWPLGAFFWGAAWTALAWCELRDDFRSFRLERIGALDKLAETYPDMPGRRLTDYFRLLQYTHEVPMSDFDPL